MSQRRTSAEIEQTRTALAAAARRIVRRSGAKSLTMRALAREANCAVGLPYKVFANRDELILQLVVEELVRLSKEFDEWVSSAGRHTVGENLDRFASILLDADSPAVLGANDIDDAVISQRLRSAASASGMPATLDAAVAEYLRGEQLLGRVRTDVNPEAFGFLITGAVHNLVAAEEQYPRPSREKLRAYLQSCADALAPDAPQ
ncbi:TetR/AcrR family transcriptional regulator [Micromonospora sp. PLK6-60]|uniref:TetR/AcrR family transcriptional regulator n=1 Tax=Micromonospora sp. PLK6-60 TaxID=2873383 RepID=UPI001CA62776|nr:TetR/AcrR family transcriptional regulator [Micromonospora sp. PLK6-60]MBY8872033.1 TetR/AcrR family transcriptional regulator [Micromonospora sp. PLK6-60]